MAKNIYQVLQFCFFDRYFVKNELGINFLAYICVLTINANTVFNIQNSFAMYQIIDVPQAYVKQVSANHYWLSQIFYGLDKVKARAEQNQDIRKYTTISLKNINENLYPQALEEIELFSESKAAKLKSELPTIENIQTTLSEVKSELLLASSIEERNFLQAFQSFIENYMNFVELLDLYAQPLTAEEELEAEKFWANEVANDISANFNDVV
jgi:hypothetical protein